MSLKINHGFVKIFITFVDLNYTLVRIKITLVELNNIIYNK